MSENNIWRNCGSCKTGIPFGGEYYQCSISSCKKHVYCSVDCWDDHNSVMGHKNAWAEENRAAMKSDGEERIPRRVIVSKSSSGSAYKDDLPKEILIVASKLKQYVKLRHDLNTSSNVMDKLSDLVRAACDEAANSARAEGRKTLMDRDF